MIERNLKPATTSTIDSDTYQQVQPVLKAIPTELGVVMHSLPSITDSLPLKKSYTFWYYLRPTNPTRTNRIAREAGFGLSLKVLATITTVQEFWAAYTRLIRPKHMPNGADLFLFETGVTPTWEDPANTHGGKFILRTTKEGTGYVWEETLIAMLRGGLIDGVVGCVVSIRGREDAVSLWVRDASKVDKVTEELRAQLGHVTSHSTLTGTEFKRHE
eukprot:PhM_4_TR15591/c0_g1_i2/m.23890/K03259/EIF4E; translation initiation factor 4E